MTTIMENWHKLVLVYLAGRKTPASPEDIRRYLERRGMPKSYTAITNVCKGSLSDFLVRHDHSTHNDDGTIRQPRFKYSLKRELSTMQKLVDAFNRDFDLEIQFMRSEYGLDMGLTLLVLLNKSLPDLGLTMRDIVRYPYYLTEAVGGSEYNKQYIEPPEIERMTGLIRKFNDVQLKKMAFSLQNSWLMLRFIVHYASSNIQTRRQLILDVLFDSQTVTLAAGKALGMSTMACNLLSAFTESENNDAHNRVLDAYKEAMDNGEIPPALYVLDAYKKLCQELCPDTEVFSVWAADELPGMWFTEFFIHLHWLRDRYPYLFD